MVNVFYNIQFMNEVRILFKISNTILASNTHRSLPVMKTSLCRSPGGGQICKWAINPKTKSTTKPAMSSSYSDFNIQLVLQMISTLCFSFIHSSNHYSFPPFKLKISERFALYRSVILHSLLKFDTALNISTVILWLEESFFKRMQWNFVNWS